MLSVSTPGVHLGDGGERASVAREVNEYAAAGRAAITPIASASSPRCACPTSTARSSSSRTPSTCCTRTAWCCSPTPRRPTSATRASTPLFDELEPPARRGVRAPLAAAGARPAARASHRSSPTSCSTPRARRAPRRIGHPRSLSRPAGDPVARRRLRALRRATGSRSRALAEGATPLDGLAQLRRFHFDIALSGSPTALPSLLAFAKPGHVLFGSDWPYAPDPPWRRVHRHVRDVRARGRAARVDRPRRGRSPRSRVCKRRGADSQRLPGTSSSAAPTPIAHHARPDGHVHGLLLLHRQLDRTELRVVTSPWCS